MCIWVKQLYLVTYLKKKKVQVVLKINRLLSTSKPLYFYLLMVVSRFYHPDYSGAQYSEVQN